MVVVVGTAACGNGTTGGSSGGGDRPKLPISSPAGGASAAATVKSEMATDAAAGATPAMAPVRPIEYRLADSAKAPATTATAYQLRKVDDVTSRVAKALGVDASDVTADTAYGDWWFSADDPSGVVSSVAVACAPDVPCEPTPPPKLEGVPSADEARTRTTSILRALGMDVAADELDVQGEDGQWRTVSSPASVDGVPVPMLTTTITFGEHGRIQDANGFLFDVDEVGDYPLVSLAKAFERHQEGFGGGVETMGVADAMPASGGAIAPTPEPAPMPPSDADCAADGPGCGPAAPPASVEPQVIEVTGARLVLEPVGTGCVDDPVYLVPAFDLQVDAQPATIGTVTAVADDAIDTPDPRQVVDQGCPDDRSEGGAPAAKPEPGTTPPDAGSAGAESGSAGSSGSGSSSASGSGTVEPTPAPAPNRP